MRDIHETRVGTYHPNPAQLFREVAWTINDTRGYIDQGPACDECGACECGTVRECAENGCHFCLKELRAMKDDPRLSIRGTERACSFHSDTMEVDEPCVGLSFAYVCLDGGETLCRECAEKKGIEIVPCDCK